MSDASLTRDAFLGGRVMVWQPSDGYRAGVDPVLLAAACPARAGQSVLELGCGVGTAMFCLGARVDGLDLTGVERQQHIADLAIRNTREGAVPAEVVCADLAHLPTALRQRGFDQVIVNPPYFDRSSGASAANPSREAALGEETPLALWLEVASRRLLPKGDLTLIHRPERLRDLLSSLPPIMGSVQVQPLVPRAGRDASLILIRARKEGRTPLRLHPPLVMHQGARHVSDADDYTPAFAAVLRDGAPLPGFGN